MNNGECEIRFKTLDGMEHRFKGEFMNWNAELISDPRQRPPVRMLTVKMTFKDGGGHIVVVKE